MRAIADLAQRARNGDAQARQTLDTIASGGVTQGASVPGWNGPINWGEADTGEGNQGGRAAERAAADAARRGNTTGFDAIAQHATAAHKDWNGGIIADALPVAAGFLAGGPIGALAAGAATGGFEAATGLTNNSVGGGILGGAAKGLGGSAIGQIAGGAMLPAGGVSGVGGAAPNLLETALSIPSAIGKFAVKNPQLALGAAGTVANVYGANQQGAAEDRALDIQAEDARRRNAPRVPFATWRANRPAPGSAPVVGTF